MAKNKGAQREEIARLCQLGFTNREVAAKLDIGTSTVNYHRGVLGLRGTRTHGPDGQPRQRREATVEKCASGHPMAGVVKFSADGNRYCVTCEAQKQAKRLPYQWQNRVAA